MTFTATVYADKALINNAVTTANTISAQAVGRTRLLNLSIFVSGLFFFFLTSCLSFVPYVTLAIKDFAQQQEQTQRNQRENSCVLRSILRKYSSATRFPSVLDGDKMSQGLRQRWRSRIRNRTKITRNSTCRRPKQCQPLKAHKRCVNRWPRVKSSSGG